MARKQRHFDCAKLKILGFFAGYKNLARERPLYCVSIGLCCTLFSALELVQRPLQISLRVPLFFFLFHCALSLCSLFFLDAFLFSGSCRGLAGHLCRVMTKSSLNTVEQLG